MASAAQAAKGQTRADKPRDYWLKTSPPLDIGRESFRVYVLRRGQAKLNVESLVESITWDDRDALMTGTVSLRKPKYMGSGAFPIDDGTQIQLMVQANPQAGFKELWRMRVNIPFESIVDGTMQFQMQNDISLLQGSADDFKYVKGRRRPRGWRVDEVIRDVCRRYGMPVALPSLPHLVKNLVMVNASPWDVIIHCMKLQRVADGRRYTIQMEAGKLTIRPLTRSKRLLELGAYLIDASHQATRSQDFATALTVRGRTIKLVKRDKKGHRVVQHKKIQVLVRSGAAVSKYGYVHRIVYDADADSAGEARAAGLRHIATIARPIREATLTHPGILGVRRGDAIRMRLEDPDEILDQIIFVKEASWAVNPGEFTMTLTLSFDDPYVNKKVDKLTEDLNQAAIGAGRKPPSKVKPKKKPVPAKASQRATGKKGTPSRRKSKVPAAPTLGGVSTPVGG